MKINKSYRRILEVCFGLFIFSIGDYLTMVANIGYTPWDSLSKALADLFGVNYGLTNALIAFIILIIDLLLKEKVGIGTIIDCFFVGYCIDLWKYLFPLKEITNPIISIIVIVVGMSIMALGQVFYMSAGLSCGPRDTLFVGIGKRFPKIKIGLIDILIKIVLIIIVYFLHGPLGVGTVIGMFGIGITMQVVYDLCKFEPRKIKHQSVIETINEMRNNNENS